MEEKQIPSLDLAFDWVKNVLNDQDHEAEYLQSKANNLFSVGTIVIGITISAGILVLNKDKTMPFVFGGFAIIAYAFVVYATWLIWRLQKFEKLDNPKVIREYYWDMEPQQFKIELLSHLEDVFDRNQNQLLVTRQRVRLLIASVISEVWLLVLALAFSL